MWLTIPVEVKGKFYQKIREARVSDLSWQTTHWKSIMQAYGKAQYFDQYRACLAELYQGSSAQYLSEDQLSLSCRPFVPC